MPELTLGKSQDVGFSLLDFQDEGITVKAYIPDIVGARQSKHQPPTQAEGDVFLELHRQICRSWQPHVVMTYGGFWMIRPLLQLSHASGAKTVFSLRNFAYKNATMFEDVDLTVVPSQFSSNYYAEKLGITSTPIASPMDWNAIRCLESEREKKFVTFVNPDPNKGVYVFAQIAKQLWERRPDIPFLVVEGRCGADWLARTGVDLRGVKNMNLMANTPDARDFYRVSKIVLVPSLFMESFGRMAAEAMINGIAVIGSNRGALPEVIGEAGLTLEIPAQYTPDSRIAPTADEVEPWVQAIIKLWDDAEFYESLSCKSLACADHWHPENTAEQYDVCLSKLIG